jgi:hypothetical protein
MRNYQNVNKLDVLIRKIKNLLFLLKTFKNFRTENRSSLCLALLILFVSSSKAYLDFFIQITTVCKYYYYNVELIILHVMYVENTGK